MRAFATRLPALAQRAPHRLRALSADVFTPPILHSLPHHRSALRLYSISAPMRPSTLGPDAMNPTKVYQPAFSKSGQLLRVDVTDTAAKKLAEVRKTDARPDMVLRIHVESGGCHGFQYVFQLPDASGIKATDSVFERDGSRVVIDHRSLRILRDATIDYTTELIGSQFKVKSPHTSSSCGCGSSFSLDEED